MNHSLPYIEEICSGAAVKLVNFPGTKGRGLVSTKSFSTGDVVFTEKPWISMQQTYNRSILTVPQTCGNCMKFLGTASEQLSFLEARLAQEDTLSVYAKVVPCSNHCGELFCSKKCLEEALSQHNILCVGPLFESHPLVSFKQFSIERNNNFLLAAKAIVKILNTAVKEGIQRALQPYSSLLSTPWQEVVERRGDISVKEMQEELILSHKLLQEGLSLVLSNSEKEILFKFFTPDFYFSFFGLFDLYTQTIQLQNPLQNLWVENSKTPNNPLHSRLSTLLQSVKALEQEMSDSDDNEEEREAEFPNMDGIGLFRLIAFTNHSCEPNCEVKYNGDDFTASIVALRAIAEGDEITHSYIENNSDFETRQEDLHVYGFTCDCPKCNSERN